MYSTCICICLAFSNSRPVAFFLPWNPSFSDHCLSWLKLKITSLFKIIEFYHCYQNLTTNCLILYFMETYFNCWELRGFPLKKKKKKKGRFTYKHERTCINVHIFTHVSKGRRITYTKSVCFHLQHDKIFPIFLIFSGKPISTHFQSCLI